MAGAVAPAVLKTGLTFANGFPVAAKIGLGIAPHQYERHPEHERFIGLEEWSTFESLDLSSWNGASGALISHRVMRALKSVVEAQPAVLNDVKSAHLSHLGTRRTGPDRELLQFFRRPSLPALRSLAFHPFGKSDAEVMEPLWKTPLMKQLETLTLINAAASTRAWFDLLPRVPQNIKVVDVGPSRDCLALRFERTETGWRVIARDGWAEERKRAPDQQTLRSSVRALKKKHPKIEIEALR